MPPRSCPSRCINTLLAFGGRRRVLLLPRASGAPVVRPVPCASPFRSVMRISELQPGGDKCSTRRGLLHGVRHVVGQFTGRADLCHSEYPFNRESAARNRFCAAHPLGSPRVPLPGLGNMGMLGAWSCPSVRLDLHHPWCCELP
jgi:hypothetical protein